MNKTTSAHYYENIDVLRGFAAISVLIYHVIEHFHWKNFPDSGALLWFRSGWMGVDLFFVISGFVIGLSAFSEIDRSGVGGFRVPFITRRFARIVPLHYLTMLVFVVFIVPEVMFNGFAANLLSHLVFLHNLDIRWHGAINGSNWSLGTEMQFYVLILLIGPWVRDGRPWAIFFVLVGISWAWRFGVASWVQPSPVMGPFPIFVAATQLPGMLDEFAAGLLLARFVRSPYAIAWIERPILRICVWLAAIAMTSLAMAIYWRYASYWDNSWMITMWRTLLAFSFALIVLVTISLPLNAIVRRMLAPLFYLGTISYGIYLWHLPVMVPLTRLTWLSPSTAAVISVLASCLLASISWHFVEKPLVERFRTRRTLFVRGSPAVSSEPAR